jgi:hypothetical protein
VWSAGICCDHDFRSKAAGPPATCFRDQIPIMSRDNRRPSTPTLKIWECVLAFRNGGGKWQADHGPAPMRAFFFAREQAYDSRVE